MRHGAKAVLAALVVGLAVSAVAVPAGANTAGKQSAGKQSFKGIIFAGRKHGRRVVVHSVIVARGAFRGVGRVVEVPNRPGDSSRVSRDDLVFSGGRMHLVNTNKSVDFSLNPRTCVFRGRIGQTAKIEGGTGRFRDAAGSFSGSVHVRGVADRDSKGKCSMRKPALQDVDSFFAHGHLSP